MPNNKPPIPHGLYEQLATEGLIKTLDAAQSGAAIWGDLDEAEAPLHLSRFAAEAIQRALKALPAKDRPQAQVHLLNRLIDAVREVVPGAAEADDQVLHQLLLAYLPESGGKDPVRPGIPLSDSDLLVNARNEYRIGHELHQEIESADRIDLICSFIKWGGVRLLMPALDAHLKKGRPMRVLTTTYLGSTDQKALDKLLDMGAEIRVSYDTRRTRLHAKAWLLYRESGFSTAYIGSSNLSATAQTDGLEWNVRISAVDAVRIIRKFEAAFSNYWDDGEFIAYDGSEESRETFRRAIMKEQGPPDTADPILHFDVRPYPFQSEILDQLETERAVHGRTKNLVVAATGTGKTVIAGLDYKGLRDAGRVGSLLFIAHREEILRQSRLAFRHVMRDGSFGELQVAGHRPEEGHHVFASIQSLAHVDLEDLDPEGFDMVIVDEIHHGSAPTYERLLSHLKPKYLLGLTATPERADGRSILRWFDGHTAAEIRVWDAIERGLLAPFQYFGVHDNTDLSGLTWSQGRYATSELESLYTADHLRVNMVLETIRTQILDPLKMRALGFCVSIRHAEFMADAFNRVGIPSMALTSETDGEVRRAAVSRLQRGEIAVIFTVDLFNEGVDIPFVDTVLFLRPTESATIFIQQLGRGLRLHSEKECLTVLDFVGSARREFRFDNRFGALLQIGRGKLREQVERGFPLLPSGCSIRLDRQSREIILENLRQSVGSGKRSLVAELSKDPDCALATFLHDTGLELEDIYRGGRSFSDLRRAAGGRVPDAGPKEDALAGGLIRILHLDDPGLIRAARRFLQGDGWHGYSRRALSMFLVPLLGPEAHSQLASSEKLLFQHTALTAELVEILDLLLERVRHVPQPFESFPDVPLKLHCRYTRDQIMAAFDVTKNGVLYRPREGVVFEEVTRCNLLFVTVNKSEKDYSPSTMYEDYALSPSEFHWQSQATTRSETEKGRRHWAHRNEKVTPLLFVRESKKTEYGATEAYFFLGPVQYGGHHGARPMNVTWELERPIPADWMRRLRVAS